MREPLLHLRHPHGWLVGVRPPSAEAEIQAAVAELPPEERAVAAEMGSFRASTFAAGRQALRMALRAAGADPGPIGTDARGAPICPPGFVGSLAHKPELAVAIADVADGRGLGVDVEVHDRERWRIESRILTPAESAEVAAARQPSEPTGPWRLVLGRFSIKEAIYKAIDPFVGRYVGFHEAELLDLVDPGISPFEAPRFTSTPAALTLAQGEGTAEIEATWADAGLVLATARIRFIPR
ncbi:MAG: 4'-phosphopantetheinyl transferase superfamily protein [Myxococcota bacterium]